MKKMMSAKELSHHIDELEKVKYRCKCGSKVIIPYHVEKNICQNCHRYVFRDKQREFEYRMKEKLYEKQR